MAPGVPAAVAASAVSVSGRPQDGIVAAAAAGAVAGIVAVAEVVDVAEAEAEAEAEAVAVAEAVAGAEAVAEAVPHIPAWSHLRAASRGGFWRAGGRPADRGRAGGRWSTGRAGARAGPGLGSEAGPGLGSRGVGWADRAARRGPVCLAVEGSPPAHRRAGSCSQGRSAGRRPGAGRPWRACWRAGAGTQGCTADSRGAGPWPS